MNKIQKALQKLLPKQKAAVKELLKNIETGNLVGLDVKKLKGIEYKFRVRKGSIRIIFEMKGDEAKVLSVTNRNDTTYNF